MAGLVEAEGAVQTRLTARLSTAIDYTVCLPVRNEEALLPATLAALGEAMAQATQTGACVFLLNDTADGSARIIERWAKETGTAFVLAQAAFPAASATAPRARRIALEIGMSIAPGAPLLTTDADTLVAPNWIVGNLNWLREGADLVCGEVDVSPAELGALAPAVRRCGQVEAAYTAALRRLWQRWTGGTAPDPLLSVMGASLAIRPEALRTVGGLPLPPVGEDRALAQTLAEQGFRVVAAPDVRVTTSLRLNGRAQGGVSDTLRQRAADPDPPCDEKLRTVAAMRALAGRWHELATMRDAAARFARVLGALGGAAQARMTLSQVEREVALAEALLQKSTADEDGPAIAAE